MAPYRQIIQQVRQAVLTGRLRAGDQLPTVREVVTTIAINPNTVFKAYRELEHEGLVELRQGQGTFVRGGSRTVDSSELAALRRGLLRWMKGALRAGLDPDTLVALYTTALQEAQQMSEETA
jgi:DNA-binding transcriptional regulator YhcF (GntR family)